MKSILVFLTIFLPVSTAFGQTIRIDYSPTTESMAFPKPGSSVFGLYQISYSYEHPYTHQEISHFGAFSHPDSMLLEMDLPVPTEVRVSILGTENGIHLNLWLTPKEELTLVIKNPNFPYSLANISFAAYKELVAFKSPKGNDHQVYSFLKAQFYSESKTSFFEVGAISNDYEKQQWQVYHTPDTIIAFYKKGITSDFKKLREFVKTQQLSAGFESSFQQELLAEWLEEVASHIPEREEIRQPVFDYFLANYSKTLFQKPTSPAYSDYVHSLLELVDPESLSYNVSFTGVIRALTTIVPKEEWPGIYSDCAQYQTDEGYLHFEEILNAYPEEAEKIRPHVRTAQKMEGNLQEMMVIINWLKPLKIPVDYKLVYTPGRIESHNDLLQINDQELLDSLYLHIGSFSAGSELNNQIRAAYLKLKKDYYDLPVYAHKNIYLPQLETDAALDSVVQANKGKVVILLMLGHNAEDNRKSIGSAAMKYIQDLYGDNVVCVMLTVDKMRKSGYEQTFKFAQTFREYGITNGFVVPGTNAFWQNIYNGTNVSAIRIYKPDGSQLPLGEIRNNLPKTALPTLIESALK